MLSKEEIENENRKHIKEVLTEYKDHIFEFDATNLCIADILEYIEQLESDKQKLIKKLEEDIENSNKGIDTNIILIKEYYKNKKEYAEEVLEILKGENHE